MHHSTREIDLKLFSIAFHDNLADTSFNPMLNVCQASLTCGENLLQPGNRTSSCNDIKLRGKSRPIPDYADVVKRPAAFFFAYVTTLAITGSYFRKVFSD